MTIHTCCSSNPVHDDPHIQVILLVVPGGEAQPSVDHDGEAAVAVLRAIGLPTTVVAVQGGGGAGGGTSTPAGMKERSAAKRRAEKAVATQVRLL